MFQAFWANLVPRVSALPVPRRQETGRGETLGRRLFPSYK